MIGGGLRFKVKTTIKTLFGVAISPGVPVASVVRSYCLYEIPLPDLANWSAFLEVILST